MKSSTCSLGSTQRHTIWLSVIEKSDGILLVYAINNKASFEKLSKFRELVIRLKGLSYSFFFPR